MANSIRGRFPDLLFLGEEEIHNVRYDERFAG
jgi:hypothetical protein